MIPAAPTTSGHADAKLASGGGDENDRKPPLLRWFIAPVGADADRLLAHLLEETAWPAIYSTVYRKCSFRQGSSDADDLISEARLQVIRSLQRLRENPPDPEKLSSFDLPAYAATVTYTVWADYLRRRHPARAILHNSLRYLLENRAGPRGFALWRSLGGERLAGFAAWQAEGREAVPTPRQQWLLTDPSATIADAFGGADRVPNDLAALTAGLLDWLGGPVEFHDLIHALTESRGLGGAGADLSEEGEPAAPDPGPTPPEALRWKEYLGWLWREVMKLPLRQRTAFLCRSSLLREMELCGLTSIRAAAVALEIAPERMAEIWSRLPLNDLDIAALLGDGSRQQVINLRKAARANLGRAWQESQDA